MTRSTNTPSHDKVRLATKINDCVGMMKDNHDIQSRIAKMRGERSLEEMEERDLRNILNAVHNRSVQ